MSEGTIQYSKPLIAELLRRGDQPTFEESLVDSVNLFSIVNKEGKIIADKIKGLKYTVEQLMNTVYGAEAVRSQGLRVEIYKIDLRTVDASKLLKEIGG